jgi:hypothetical protein
MIEGQPKRESVRAGIQAIAERRARAKVATSMKRSAQLAFSSWEGHNAVAIRVSRQDGVRGL